MFPWLGAVRGEANLLRSQELTQANPAALSASRVQPWVSVRLSGHALKGRLPASFPSPRLRPDLTWSWSRSPPASYLLCVHPPLRPSPALPTITSSILLRLSGSGNLEVRAGRDCCPNFLHFTEKKPRPREGACSGHTAGSLQWILSEVCVFPSCWNITMTWVAENNRCLFSCSSGGWKSAVRVPARLTFL